MNDILKAACLAIYVLAVAGAVQTVAVVLFFLHVLELPIAFGSLKRHSGPLVDSIALALLFGLLHWWPLRART